jgi:hypothetical protein
MHSREPELNGDGAAAAARGADARLVRALQRLPELEPPADGWARLERRIGRPPGWPLWAPTLAAAACALLVAVGLLLRPDVSPAPLEGADFGTMPPRDATAGAPLTASEWRSRSVELERLLADVPEPRVTRASTALTTTLLEDRIALIDEQLSDAAGGASSADAGWLYRERVLLLDSLVRVRYAAAVDPAT